MMVFPNENGMLSSSWPSAQVSGPCTERSVKYIANSAAKNMSSEASQTIVPTLTVFGRTNGPGWTPGPSSTTVVAATGQI